MYKLYISLKVFVLKYLRIKIKKIVGYKKIVSRVTILNQMITQNFQI